MYGFLTADTGSLTREEFERYRACYCGLCRSLGERHGLLGRLTLNYDMTFLVLLLGSMYEPDEAEETFRCTVHPEGMRTRWRSIFSDYAADMNAALAYLKCRDDWDDDCSPSAKLQAALLKKHYEQAEKAYPRQTESMKTALKRLSDYEKIGNPNADECADCFGELMGEIFVWNDEDYWADSLRRFGYALGKFIYICDAAVDREEDIKKGRFNPFGNTEQSCADADSFREILNVLLSDCVRTFDYLPLIKDTAILKNILCLGLWIEFNKKYPTEKEQPDVSRPVQRSRCLP